MAEKRKKEDDLARLLRVVEETAECMRAAKARLTIAEDEENKATAECAAALTELHKFLDL